MKSNFKSWPEFHHQINMIYHVVIAISLIPFALVFLGIDSGKTKEPNVAAGYEWGALLILLPLATLPCYFVWKDVRNRLRKINSKSGIKERLQKYLGLQTRRYLLLELSALVSLLGLWLTTNYLFVITYLLALVQFSLLRPSQDKVIRDLQFNKEDREKLRAPEL